MNENSRENECRTEILNAVGNYYDAFLANSENRDGLDRINYAGRVFDAEELKNLVDASLDFWLTSGPYSEQFEKDLGRYLGIPYVNFVNSGSSANLLAFMALTQPELGDRAIRRGDEVITVAAGFPTTITPIMQYGAVPVFVDIAVPQYNIDVSLLKDALSEKTKAVVLAHTLGNPFDLNEVKSFCDEHGLWLIEDNCDALGSEYCYNGVWKKTGTIGDIGTSSFYPPHHMTTGEGGAVYTSNAKLHAILRSLRDWGRDCVCPSGKDDSCGHRFDMQFGELPRGYDHKYTYSRFGYNLKATDLQAAIGCAQLEKLPHFVEARRHNFDYLKRSLECIDRDLILPEACPNSIPSWFGFLITCATNADRDRLVRCLEDANVQTRALFSGNIIRHPCFDHIRNTGAYRVLGTLDNTDRVMQNSFWVGVYPGMTEEMLDRMANLIRKATRE